MENKNIKKYALDVDGVCVNFDKHFINTCGKLDIKLKAGKIWNYLHQDIRSYDVFNKLEDDFWLALEREPKSLDLKIKPIAYISHRSCDTEVTRKCLVSLGFPDAPVYHVKYTDDKIKVARELGVDIYIDDRASTVINFLENGVEAYVLEQPCNEDFGVPRVYTLGQLTEEGIKEYGRASSDS